MTRVVAMLVLGMVWLAGCSDAPESTTAPTDGDPAGPITVASFDFTESRIVGEIYAQALESWGYPTDRALGLAPRELLEPALEQGLVDLVPEYAGTALQFLTDDTTLASADPSVTNQRLRSAFAERGIAVLEPAPAQNQNALAVRRDTAVRYRLSTVSDLEPVASHLVLGGPPECPTRPLCLVGYTDVYGLQFRRFAPVDVGGPLTLAALEGGEIDVAVLFTGDRPLVGSDVVYLTDDRGLQPAENITPVLRQEVLDAFGSRLGLRIDLVTRRLTTPALARLVRRADVDREEPARLAERWLTHAGVTTTAFGRSGEE